MGYGRLADLNEGVQRVSPGRRQQIGGLRGTCTCSWFIDSPQVQNSGRGVCSEGRRWYVCMIIKGRFSACNDRSEEVGQEQFAGYI